LKRLSKIKIRRGRYRHYKGNYYEVLGTARYSETLEEMVVYRALYHSKFGRRSLWVRPQKMFAEKIVVAGKKVARFQYVGHSARKAKRKELHRE